MLSNSGIYKAKGCYIQQNQRGWWKISCGHPKNLYCSYSFDDVFSASDSYLPLSFEKGVYRSHLFKLDFCHQTYHVHIRIGVTQSILHVRVQMSRVVSPLLERAFGLRMDWPNSSWVLQHVICFSLVSFPNQKNATLLPSTRMHKVSSCH